MRGEQLSWKSDALITCRAYTPCVAGPSQWVVVLSLPSTLFLSALPPTLSCSSYAVAMKAVPSGDVAVSSVKQVEAKSGAVASGKYT
jgi:hypothetical protein